RQAELARGLGDPRRLAGIGGRAGPSPADRAAAAEAPGDVAHEHERRGALAGPALVDVGTARLLAHGNQREPPHHAPHLLVLARRVEADLQTVPPFEAART